MCHWVRAKRMRDCSENRPLRARVTLHSGEELQLERTGDLGARNAGILIFVEGRERPELVRRTDLEQVDLNRPPAMYHPVGTREPSGTARWR